MPALDALGTYCTVYRRSVLENVAQALEYCFERGWPADFHYGYLTRKYHVRLAQTSRNLAGQAPRFRSSLHGSLKRGTSFYSQFRACRHPLEYYAVAGVYYVVRRVRQIWRREPQAATQQSRG